MVDIEVLLYPEDEIRVGTARPVSVGAIIGFRPVVSFNHRDFDTLWAMALAGHLRCMYLNMVYISLGMRMSKPKTAKPFRNGRSQAVRLPREFRFEGNEVRIRQWERVSCEPGITDVRRWFAELDHYKTAFIKKGIRKQPQTLHREMFDKVIFWLVALSA